jgi:hemerythrin superfamily protein
MANPLDQVISKGAGLAHEIKARMDGLVGVFDTLAEQHAEAAALLQRAKANENKWSELWPTIRAALKSHEQAELRVVYPVLREYPQLTALADRHRAQADELGETIDKMSALGPRSPQFAIMLDHLIVLVVAHADEEETQIFPAAQGVIGETRARQLDAELLPIVKQINETEMPVHRH